MTGLILATALAVSSQVTDVTVYNDRAQVVRTADVELKSGINTIRFEELPSSVDARGIQVEGSGAATVLDMRFKIENYEAVPQAVWQELYDREEALNEERAAVEQRKAAYQESKEFLLKISSKVTSTNQKEGSDKLNPESWEQMLDMYLEQQMAYDADIRKAALEIKAIDEKLNKIRADIKTTGASRNKQRRVVEVDVEMVDPGPVELRLSYLVRGPTWMPTYDVRVDTETRRMEVKSFALIRQNTGEDWKDITLKLSTASPNLGGQHATLQPWRLRMVEESDNAPWHRNKAPSTSNLYNSYADNAFESVSTGVLSTMGGAPAVMVMREATTSRQGTAVVFTPTGVSTVESDNVEHRVAVSSAMLPSSFRYSVVPKLDAHAYLKAKAVNTSGHPFLAGNANIFLDGSYVTTSSLSLVPPEEEFWVFLGVDAGMTVEYKLLKRYKSGEGRRDRTTRHTFEYLIKIKNTHANAEEFIVWDQLPISSNEDIEVKLLEPDYSKDTDSLKIDDEQRISWFQTLEPGAEWEIPFSFYVDAPKEMKIDGL
ncbi:mucoidy inhibitor MuiA family protein [Pontiellaceae bacterium B1224]|nr:mucoidy inhibitor MuiA family protein [Pontiellaceae bacterium B1224]